LQRRGQETFSPDEKAGAAAALPHSESFAYFAAFPSRPSRSKALASSTNQKTLTAQGAKKCAAKYAKEIQKQAQPPAEPHSKQ
jgi:hypothetical protein